ncbi:hypothetical protein T492DRAFT_1031064 [Pavlovales sp. CCMP2436]|nr:hypothetical protein T492DRAFT_1031064 [Pavlovales sp. CCMP2436]
MEIERTPPPPYEYVARSGLEYRLEAALDKLDGCRGGAPARYVSLFPSGAGGDPYFADDRDVIQSYPFDYEQVVSFKRKVGAASLATLCVSPCCLYGDANSAASTVAASPALGTWCVGVVLPCCLVTSTVAGAAFLNIRDEAQSWHVATTQDGLRIVKERHPAALRCTCSDVGKQSRTIPYDQITDCDVEEPAGNALLCCVPNVLRKLKVSTASSSELIEGLADPEQLKRDVWSMKRGEGISADPSSVVPTRMVRLEGKAPSPRGSPRSSGRIGGFLSRMGRGKGESEEVGLLLERTSMLTEMVGHLKDIAENAPGSAHRS